MSIRTIQSVWDYSQSGGIDRLVLTVIANYAQDDGTGAYPSVETIAKACGSSVRTVQYALRALEKLGEIVIEKRTSRYGTNVYNVVLQGCKVCTPDVQRGVQNSKSIRVQDPASRGADVCTQSVNTINPKRERTRARSPFDKPSVDVLRQEFRRIGVPVGACAQQAALFENHYELTGREEREGQKTWMVGKNPMQDWQRAVYGWALRANLITAKNARPRTGAVSAVLQQDDSLEDFVE